MNKTYDTHEIVTQVNKIDFDTEKNKIHANM